MGKGRTGWVCISRATAREVRPTAHNECVFFQRAEVASKCEGGENSDVERKKDRGSR